MTHEDEAHESVESAAGPTDPASPPAWRRKWITRGALALLLTYAVPTFNPSYEAGEPSTWTWPVFAEASRPPLPDWQDCSRLALALGALLAMGTRPRQLGWILVGGCLAVFGAGWIEQASDLFASIISGSGLAMWLSHAMWAVGLAGLVCIAAVAHRARTVPPGVGERRLALLSALGGLAMLVPQNVFAVAMLRGPRMAGFVPQALNALLGSISALALLLPAIAWAVAAARRRVSRKHTARLLTLLRVAPLALLAVAVPSGVLNHLTFEALDLVGGRGLGDTVLASLLSATRLTLSTFGGACLAGVGLALLLGVWTQRRHAREFKESLRALE